MMKKCKKTLLLSCAVMILGFCQQVAAQELQPAQTQAPQTQEVQEQATQAMESHHPIEQPAEPVEAVPPTQAIEVMKQVQPIQPVPVDTASPPILGTIKPDDTSRFCKNIDDSAAEAHFELRRRELETLRTQLDERIEILEQKRQEYEVWLKKRDDFLAKTQDSFVEIISKMKPDAASAQLALVDDMTVAGLMLKLKPATASKLMNELPAEKAANITHILSSAQKLPHRKTPTMQPQPVD